jgi:hypothetical protein
MKKTLSIFAATVALALSTNSAFAVNCKVGDEMKDLTAEECTAQGGEVVAAEEAATEGDTGASN